MRRGDQVRLEVDVIPQFWCFFPPLFLAELLTRWVRRKSGAAPRRNLFTHDLLVQELRVGRGGGGRGQLLT